MRRSLAVPLLAAGALAFLAAPAGARTQPPVAAHTNASAITVSSTGCPPAFPDLRTRAHSEVVRRETTLDDLSTRLSAAQDPWRINGGLLNALAGAKTTLTALDQHIQTTCYPTREALRSDVGTIFTVYRIYWLRVPQAHLVEEADHLGMARGKLQNVEQTLAGLVGSNSRAQADLTAMRTALTAFDTTLGTVPNVTTHLASVAQLAPAADMTSNVAVMQAARGDLRSARQSLGQASADAHKVIKDLGL
ncbi:MAG: hypothetical protein JOZ99_12880 [Actinobacteria bacterium]|nr:hypothetical protein [Actinomycetota bacterium]